MLATAYIVSELLVKSSSLLPANRNRSFLVHSLVQAFGLLKQNGVQVVTPTPASPSDLCMFHDKCYVEYLTGPHVGVNDDFGIVDDCPPFRGIGLYCSLVAGASLTAARCLASGRFDFAIAWDGGRHHAQKSRASGFCYVNDCVLSILKLCSSSKPSPRVLYLDLDLHYCDGVSEAFTSSSNVMTISVHHCSPGFFPDSSAFNNKDEYTLSIPLAVGASNATFSRVWSNIESLKARFTPDYVVVQCGVDGLAGDPCGVWNWGLDDGEGSLAWCIRRIVKLWGVKTLFLGGGGYNSPNAARAWALLTSIIVGSPLTGSTAIPDSTRHFPLYAPSFTLDIPKGNMADRNVTDDKLEQLPGCL